MKRELVNRTLSMTQVAQIYNGAVEVEEETTYIVHIYPSGCPNCTMLHTLLLQIEQGLKNENIEIYSFCYEEEPETTPLILQKLMGPSSKDHGCIMSSTIKKGIRKRISVLTSDELDARLPPDLDNIPANLLVTTLKNLIIGDNL